MKATVLTSNYSVDLTDSQWERLNALEDWGSALVEDMEEAGASNVEWNGHFGQAIFFTADPRDVKKIMKVLKEQSS